jgi:hypothetical protein
MIRQAYLLFAEYSVLFTSANDGILIEIQQMNNTVHGGI